MQDKLRVRIDALLFIFWGILSYSKRELTIINQND